ncbi:unnamed protein product [Brassicogethes aeneus]|uniref:PHD-type domain-containing protein n=1 Tax=Brassicogethes aeneus TaxID=1431903 RepID=A0A9P0FIN3_BRAAE|nr:unnamed protein product [Brassicogethes aeneus]
MASLCGSCTKTTRNTYALNCTKCEKWFHMECGGLTKDGLKKIEAELKKPDGKRWKCAGCSESEVKEGMGDPTLKDLMLKLIQMDQKMDDLTKKYEEQLKINKNMQIEINNLQKKVVNLENEKNHIERKNLKNNIIISGLPVVKKENLTRTVVELAKKYNVLLKNEDFVCSQVGKANEDGKQLIKVKFNKESDKERIMKSKKEINLKADVLRLSTDSDIYINDELTKCNRNLFTEARKKGINLYGARKV